ncbi:MAG: addiction module protein [Planctomycetaceae bacterium]|nr:addiction module protein [Planctomycetaceae bacterium]
MSPEIVPIASLPLDRKLELLDELWGAIADDPALAETPPWHLEVLAARAAELERNPHATVAWSELRKELLEDHP